MCYENWLLKMYISSLSGYYKCYKVFSQMIKRQISFYLNVLCFLLCIVFHDSKNGNSLFAHYVQDVPLDIIDDIGIVSAPAQNVENIVNIVHRARCFTITCLHRNARRCHNSASTNQNTR